MQQMSRLSLKQIGLRVITVCILLASFSTTYGQKNNTYVGAYLNDITGFDLKEGRFNADLYVWVKWLGDSVVPEISFANGEIDLKEELSSEREGDWNSVKWRIQGTFRGTFPLQSFPFDHQTLKIQIDLPAEYGMLMPDLAGSGMAEQFSITGWDYDPLFKAEVAPITYFSDFGSVAHEGIPYEVNTISLKVELHRPKTGVIAKYIFPLLIIVSISIAALILPPARLDARIGLGVNALIACVAFQFAISSSIPDVSYLVVADRLFIVSYSIILVSILNVLLNYRRQLVNPEKAKKVDRFFSYLFPILIIGFGCWQVYDLSVSNENVAVADNNERSEVVVNHNDTLTIGRPINHFSYYKSLYYRGLYHQVAGGEKVPHLIEQVPALTNDLVSYFQDGSVSVKWIFRPEVKWGDGSPITAEDILFSIDVRNDQNMDTVIQLEFENKLGFELKYKHRLNNILEEFQLYPKSFFEGAYLSGGMDSVDHLFTRTPPPLDGPYTVASFDPKKEAVFIRNPHYLGEAARIPAIKIRAVVSVGEAIKGDSVDLSYGLPLSVKEIADSLPNYTGRIDDSYEVAVLLIDVNHYPFNNPEVRQAISYAINRDSVLWYAKGGIGAVANSYVPPLMADYLGAQDYFPYDTEKARAILKEAGVKPGQEIKLVSSWYYEGSVHQPILDYMSRALQDVGLKVEVAKESVWSHQKDGDAKCLMYRGIDYIDNDLGFLWMMDYEPEIGGISYDTPQGLFIDELFELKQKYDASLFVERRIALSKQMQMAYLEQMPSIPLFFSKEFSLHNSKLNGWNPMAANGDYWWNVEYMYFSEENVVEVQVEEDSEGE
jgi:peptide/nickel transport system substrate-binding protein